MSTIVYIVLVSPISAGVFNVPVGANEMPSGGNNGLPLKGTSNGLYSSALVGVDKKAILTATTIASGIKTPAQSVINILE